VVPSDVADKHAGGLVDVEGADGDHLLEVGPVLRLVEERLEHGQIGTAQKGDRTAAKLAPRK